MAALDAEEGEQGLAGAGAELLAGQWGEHMSNWPLSLSLGGERSSATSDHIPHYVQAGRLKSVQIPPTALLHHHHAWNLHSEIMPDSPAAPSCTLQLTKKLARRGTSASA